MNYKKTTHKIILQYLSKKDTIIILILKVKETLECLGFWNFFPFYDV